MRDAEALLSDQRNTSPWEKELAEWGQGETRRREATIEKTNWTAGSRGTQETEFGMSNCCRVKIGTAYSLTHSLTQYSFVCAFVPFTDSA